MMVFCHHIYEYKKGLRNLVLHTLPAAARPDVERKLTSCGIDYLIHPLGEKRINVFFGAEDCVEIVRCIGKPCLSDYSPEEDFMLGIMLGYDRLRQCERYLERRERGQFAARGTVLVFERAGEGTMFVDTQEIGNTSGRSDRNSYEDVTPEEEGHHSCGGQGCTGCLTGNPCPACIALQARMNGTKALAKAVSE